MDVILLPWLHSTDEVEREHLLAELLQTHAVPLIRYLIRQRLGLFVSQDGRSQQPDAEDLFHDILTSLLRQLHQLQADSHSQHSPILNFRQYVTRTAINHCHTYLRARSPERTRLRYKLRDLLERHPDFSLYRNDKGQMLCGFAQWKQDSFAQGVKPAVAPEIFSQTRFAHEDVPRLPLPRIVAEILRWMNAPVELDDLVSFTAALLGIRGQLPQSLDADDEFSVADSISDDALRPDEELAEREWLHDLWEEVRRLPRPQRETLCLSYFTESGEDLLSLLLDAGVVTLEQLAAEMEMTLEEMMRTLRQVPMDSPTLAARLGTTPQQINRWRHRGLAKLRQRLAAEKFNSAPVAFSDPTPVS